jgi:uncharacterized protein (TIGR02996 family)
MNLETAFLRAIREAPDDDAPRLVYADWLTDHGDESGRARADLIRVQCELARLDADDPRRGGLAAREAALLDAHADWPDLDFAAWLGHRKRGCRNPEGHDFCKIVRDGVLARCERDRLPEDDPRRKRLQAKLDDLGRRMDGGYNFLAPTCEMPLYESPVFRRGFVESATVQDWAVNLFAEALPHVGVLRELEIENDTVVDGAGDVAMGRLIGVLGKLPLESLDVNASIDDLETIGLLVSIPAARRLKKLGFWCDDGLETGDECAAVLAGSPHLCGLRDLEMGHSEGFTEEDFLAVLDSPHLTGLVRCRLRHSDGHLRIRESVVRRFAARFGAEVEDDVTVVPDELGS